MDIELQKRKLHKQLLKDLEHRLSKDLGEFLVLIEEANETAIDRAKQNARSSLLKYGPEMRKTAQLLGGKMPELVQSFLETIDNTLHAAQGWIDEAQILKCYRQTEELEKEIRAA